MKEFEHAIIGIEIEMYSKLPRQDIAKQLSALLKKRVEVRRQYHSKVKADTWKLEPDFSGGILMHELVSPPMPYYEAIMCLTRILAWMRGAAWTDEKCAFQFNISFNKKRANLKTPIEGVNRLKFVLGFDEEYVYRRFPKRKNSVYARSISTIIPNNKFQTSEDTNTSANPANYELPYDKFYGINFTKLPYGYLEFRYLGGKSYEKKPIEIREVIEYSVRFLHDTLQHNEEYTQNDIARLRIAMAQHKKASRPFLDPEEFLVAYPNLKVFCNLSGDIQTLKTYWVEIREKLFELIVKCGVRTGYFNYDSEVGRYQLKEAYIPTAFALIGMELIDCRIRGNVAACDLYGCVVAGSHIASSRIREGCEVTDSKILTSPIFSGSRVTACYIDNRDSAVSGRIERSVIRSGDVTKAAEIIDCELVYKLIGAAKNGGAVDPKGAPEYWDKLSGDKKGDKKMGDILAGYIGGTELPVEKDDKGGKSGGKSIAMPGVNILEPTKKKA